MPATDYLEAVERVVGLNSAHALMLVAFIQSNRAAKKKDKVALQLTIDS